MLKNKFAKLKKIFKFTIIPIGVMSVTLPLTISCSLTEQQRELARERAGRKPDEVKHIKTDEEKRLEYEKGESEYLKNLIKTNYGSMLIDYFIEPSAVPANFDLKTGFANLKKQFDEYLEFGKLSYPLKNGYKDGLEEKKGGGPFKKKGHAVDFYYSAFYKYIKKIEEYSNKHPNKPDYSERLEKASRLQVSSNIIDPYNSMLAEIRSSFGGAKQKASFEIFGGYGKHVSGRDRMGRIFEDLLGTLELV